MKNLSVEFTVEEAAELAQRSKLFANKLASMVLAAQQEVKNFPIAAQVIQDDEHTLDTLVKEIRNRFPLSSDKILAIKWLREIIHKQINIPSNTKDVLYSLSGAKNFVEFAMGMRATW